MWLSDLRWVGSIDVSEVSGEKLLCRDATEGYVKRIYALND